LIEAADRGHEACVRVLIAAKADVAYADRYGSTALHVAACNDHFSICRVLIDESASLTVENEDGQAPLEVAKVQGNAKCIAILEAAGAATIAKVRESEN